jgi:hypothetical protein
MQVVNKTAVKFKRVERRFVYTTPKSFLELLKLYGVLLNKKRYACYEPLIFSSVGASNRSPKSVCQLGGG